MLRSVVPWSLAIFVMVSPVLTRYVRKDGCGVNVGRLNVRLGEGDAADTVAGGALVGGAVAGGCGVGRPGGCGTHAETSTANTTAVETATPSDGSSRWLLMPHRTHVSPRG